MLRIWAVLFGIAFIFAGVAGFLPSFMPNDLLFGYFEVNSMHNIVHIATGVIAIMMATRHSSAVLYFRVFGLLYGAVAVMGFWRQGDLFMMQVNMADNILHAAIAVIAIYLGFMFGRKRV